MTVEAILRHKGHEVVCVPPHATMSEVSHTLADRRIGAVLVRESAGPILGIVSERDIVCRLATDGAACLDMAADQVMTRVLHTVAPGTSPDDAMGMMTANRVRHLPVLDHGALVGMISIGDVVKARLDEQLQEVDSLKAYVAGSM